MQVLIGVLQGLVFVAYPAGFDFLFVHPCFFEAPHHYRRLFRFVAFACHRE